MSAVLTWAVVTVVVWVRTACTSVAAGTLCRGSTEASHTQKDRPQPGRPLRRELHQKRDPLSVPVLVFSFP